MGVAGGTVPQRLREVARRFPDRPIQYVKDANGDFKPITFRDFFDSVERVAAALVRIGVGRGDHVGIMSDNRSEWLVTDVALLSIGAADVPRGCDSTATEMIYILAHADCRLSFVENRAQLQKILSNPGRVPMLERVIVFDDAELKGVRNAYPGVEIMTYGELLGSGGSGGSNIAVASPDDSQFSLDRTIDEGHEDELATILYTSGTTGEPKGVLLPHRSFGFQMDRVRSRLFLDENDVFMTVLPIWHSFERAVEYVALGYGASIAYSKPIAKLMMDDMAKIRPTWMTSVPRIWEGIRAAVYRNISQEPPIRRALFSFFVAVGSVTAILSDMWHGRLPRFVRRSRLLDKIVAAIPLLLLSPFRALGKALVFHKLTDRLGGRFVAGVSGGGALPPHVDAFFRAVGIKLLEGYGLTETGPVLAVRHQTHPVPATVGSLLPDIEYRVTDEAGNPLPPNQKGVLHVRSPQVMLGYYKKPDETNAVLRDGWLSTGDLVVFSLDGAFKVLGRVKETIVLLGGENVEPAPIEERLMQSDWIEQAMVVGQDKKFLGVLVVPDTDKTEAFAKTNGLAYHSIDELVASDEIRKMIQTEVQSLVSRKHGFKPFEEIYRVHLLAEKFEVGKELTLTLKKKRDVIEKKYRKEIEALFRSDSRRQDGRRQDGRAAG